MDEKERLEFLRRMGLPVGRLGKTDEEIRRRTRVDNRVEKSDLLALAKTFDVLPERKKPQSLDEFLKEEEHGKGDSVD